MKRFSTTVIGIFKELGKPDSDKLIKLFLVGTKDNLPGHYRGTMDIAFFTDQLGAGSEMASVLVSFKKGDVIQIPVVIKGNGEYINAQYDYNSDTLPKKTGETRILTDEDTEMDPTLAAILKPIVYKQKKEEPAPSSTAEVGNLNALLKALQGNAV